MEPTKEQIEDTINELYLDMLPSWAEGRTYGALMMGAQLPTRDGRCMGNAHVVGFKIYSYRENEIKCWQLLTDAGNLVELTKREIETQFYPSVYYSNVQEVLRKFYREGE